MGRVSWVIVSPKSAQHKIHSKALPRCVERINKRIEAHLKEKEKLTKAL